MMETSTHLYVDFGAIDLEVKIQKAESEGWAVRHLIRDGSRTWVTYERPRNPQEQYRTFGS